MRGSATRPWILALALAACRNDSDSPPAPTGLAMRSVSFPDFGQWQSNRPVEFAFDQPIDFATVSARSIHVRTSLGVPAAGAFGVKEIDADGDGVPEGTDESVVVFFPRCPEAEDLSDAGFTPGVRYLVTLAGEDSLVDPAALLRSRSGAALALTVVRAFETIADPAGTLYDEKEGAPAPRVRAAGASSGPGCFLELGEDPSNRVFFEAGPVFGRTPSGFRAPLNLLGDRSTQVAVVVVFDQAIRSTPENLARLRLEYNSTLGPLGWRALETRAELLSNCPPDDSAVRLVALGSFPPGGFVRVRIEAGFEDLVGQATPEPLERFALTAVATVAFTSLDPAGAIADELREEFDFGAESPLSLADPVTPLDGDPAEWGQGELRAGGLAALPPALREFDWIVNSGSVFEFDTTATDIRGGPNGLPRTVQSTSGGFVAVRNLVVQEGARIQVRGPNPMVVHASGSVSIRGVIDASGLAPGFAGAPGQGSAGGGDGGPASVGAGARGGNGTGAFGAGAGGQGGESGLALTSDFMSRRAGGGGGGRFARDQGPLIAENGGDGIVFGTGAESGLAPARGGSAGLEVFVDGDPSNDFFGMGPLVDAAGNVLGLRRGELGSIHAGAGGGSGGDAITASTFPPPSERAPTMEGDGGGGGGGALVIRALGPIVFGPVGRIRATGGQGGRSAGSCGGSGSGGHVILESSTAIEFTGINPGGLWIEARGGPRVAQLPFREGFGGAGGPGVVQLHVPHPERAPGDPSSNVILNPASLNKPDPLAHACLPRPHVLYPMVGGRSVARSRWIPLGAAGEGGATGPESVVALLFGGIETAPGDHEGRVRTESGRVIELAPLVGPVNLAQPGVELLPGGLSVALSGAVLAPLRASAQPISPDVYLRTPALLEGFTLRLASLAEPAASEFTVARALYDDAASRLVLTLGGLSGTLAEAVQALGGADRVELALIPRFFRVRQGASGFDLLPDSRGVRILFQGAADDGTGRADEGNPLVDWTADVTRFGQLAPGVLDFVRFQVEFDLDVDADGFDPEDEPLVLDFLRLPMRF